MFRKQIIKLCVEFAPINYNNSLCNNFDWITKKKISKWKDSGIEYL